MPYFNGIIQDHPHPPGQGAKSSILRDPISVLCRRYRVRKIGKKECTSIKAVNGKGAVPGYFPDPTKSLFISIHQARGGGEAVICGGGSSHKLCQWESVPRGISGSSGRVVGMGETPSRGMVPRGKGYR